jgi:hypothetical protein
MPTRIDRTSYLNNSTISDFLIPDSNHGFAPYGEMTLIEIQVLMYLAAVIVTMITHAHPHLDELFGMWASAKFGPPDWVKTHCPGNAVAYGVDYPDGTEAEFNDHHPQHTLDCCATLVARSLGLLGHNWFVSGLDTLFQHDKFAKGRLELARFINTWHKVSIMDRVDEDRLVIAWTFQALDAWFYGRLKRDMFLKELAALNLGRKEYKNRIRAYDLHGGGEFGLARLTELIREQAPATAEAWIATLTRVQSRAQELLQSAKADLKANAKISSVTAGTQTLQIYTIESDDQFAGEAAFDRTLNPRCDVLFIANSDGHCQVLHNRNAQLDFTRVAVRLREYLARQMIRRGLPLEGGMPSEEALAAPFFTPGLDRLYWQGPAGPVLNGSRARMDILPLLGPGGLLTIQGMLQKIKVGLVEELAARASSSVNA